MNLLTVLAALSIAGTCTAEWTNLHLKYNPLLNGYFPIALTQEELLKGDWVYMTTDSELNVDFYSYGADPRVSIGFDTYGNIAGVRVAYIIKDLPNRADTNGLTFPFSYSDKPIFSRATYWDTDLYYTTVLFTSPETLLAGGRTETGGLVADNVYVKLNGKYTVIPRKQEDATELGFVKQGCFIGMGLHYFHDLSSTSECGTFQGVFLLYDSEELTGMGLINFGSFTSSSNRTWFENTTASIVEIIAPDRPACLTDWVTNYGTTGLHLYFKKNPRIITC